MLAWVHSRGNEHVGRSTLYMKVYADRILDVEPDMSSTRQFQNALQENVE
jgi:hypothetical protein